MRLLNLPDKSGTVSSYRALARPVVAPTGLRFRSRIAYAAAHVVADPLQSSDPWGSTAIDWEATMAFRRHLWGLGFRVAEAMDTAQRGMGLNWPQARELIRRSLAEAPAIPGAELAAGAGTDQLDIKEVSGLDDVIRGYEEQLTFIESLGGRAIIMASRALAAVARSPDDYVRVYRRLLGGVRRKVILHWLGSMFDPALEGYWGTRDVAAAMDIVAGLIAEHADKLEGIKISLLDQGHEIALRRRLPRGVAMFTGDDFNYAQLIGGDAEGHSHALLGILDAIAPVAARALERLDAGDRAGFRTLLDPTTALSRRIFEAPTRYYKSGIVFLAWLNGHQSHFAMLGGLQSARGIVHYGDIYRLADACGLLADPDLAHARFRSLLEVHGIEQPLGIVPKNPSNLLDSTKIRHPG